MKKLLIILFLLFVLLVSGCTPLSTEKVSLSSDRTASSGLMFSSESQNATVQSTAEVISSSTEPPSVFVSSKPESTTTVLYTDKGNSTSVPPKSAYFKSTGEMLEWVSNEDYSDCAFKQAVRQQDYLIMPEAVNDSFELEEIMIGHTYTHIVYAFNNNDGEAIHVLVNLPAADQKIDFFESYISEHNKRMQEQYSGYRGLYKNGELFIMGKSRETYKQDCGLATDRKTGKATPMYAEFITEIEGCIVKITLRENLLQNNWDNSLLDNFRFTRQILQP